MKLLRKNLCVIIAAFISIIIFVGIYFTHFDLFNTGLQTLLRIEDSELDEFVSAFLIVIAGFSIDALRAWRREQRKSELEDERLRVLRATMRTVHDLVNNFLGNMQLFRLEAEDGPLSPESLVLLDGLIFETADKLKALGDAEAVIEYQMASGVGILPRRPPAEVLPNVRELELNG